MMFRTRQSPSERTRPDRGFSLLEMLVVVGLIAVVASVVIPGLSDDTQLRLRAASAIVQSDIELAQVMNIARPGDPVIIQFDPDADSYWIAPAKDRMNPIVRENSGEPYVVTFGSGRASSTAGITMALSNVSASALVFNSQGGLADFATTPTIELRFGARAVRLTINPTTGRITESFADVVVTEDTNEEENAGALSILDEGVLDSLTEQLPKLP